MPAPFTVTTTAGGDVRLGRHLQQFTGALTPRMRSVTGPGWATAVYDASGRRLDIRPIGGAVDWARLTGDHLPTWCDGIRFTWSPEDGTGRVEYRSRTWLPHATLTLCGLPPGDRQVLAFDLVGACAGECPWLLTAAMTDTDVALYRAVWDATLLPGDPWEWQWDSVADFEHAVGTHRLPAPVKADVAALAGAWSASLAELVTTLAACRVRCPAP